MNFRVLQVFWVALLCLCQASVVLAQSPVSIQRQVPEDDLLVLLDEGKFEDLGRRLEALQASYMTNRSTENEVHKAFYEFYRADSRIGESLNQWVTAQPKNAMAYLARGIHRAKMGWSSRGGEFASKTTDSQFSGMAAWFDAAKEDLNQALLIDSSLVESYCYLIEIDMTEGGQRARTLFDQILKINPASFIGREFYLHSQLPRWGGSYEAMKETISNAKPHYDKTPQLEALEGREAADLGDLAAYRGDYQRAIEYFTIALSKGDFWYFNQKYGEALTQTGDLQGAVDQYSKVIRDKPGYKRAWRMRAFAYAALRQFPDAVADINYAVGMEPQDDDTIAARGRIYGSSKNYVAALNDFEMAAKINPSNPEHQQFISLTQQLMQSAKAK